MNEVILLINDLIKRLPFWLCTLLQGWGWHGSEVHAYLTIGMNSTANKFYALSNLISLSMPSLSYVHFKKLAKIKFLKYGKT